MKKKLLKLTSLAILGLSTIAVVAGCNGGESRKPAETPTLKEVYQDHLGIVYIKHSPRLENSLQFTLDGGSSWFTSQPMDTDETGTIVTDKSLSNIMYYDVTIGKFCITVGQTGTKTYDPCAINVQIRESAAETYLESAASNVVNYTLKVPQAAYVYGGGYVANKTIGEGKTETSTFPPSTTAKNVIVCASPSTVNNYVVATEKNVITKEAEGNYEYHESITADVDTANKLEYSLISNDVTKYPDQDNKTLKTVKQEVKAGTRTFSKFVNANFTIQNDFFRPASSEGLVTLEERALVAVRYSATNDKLASNITICTVLKYKAA